MMPEVDDAEMLARDLVKRGEIDQAIEIYQRLEPNPRILSAIGSVYAEKKNDYDSAINYYKEALKLQDEVNIHHKYNAFYYIVYFLFLHRKAKISRMRCYKLVIFIKFVVILLWHYHTILVH
jgi:tetratricopeptide (TPR) repeat protein